MARILNRYSNISDPFKGSENHSFRKLITNEALRHKSLSLQSRQYIIDTCSCLGDEQIFLDQSHPLLFHVEEIVQILGGSVRFIFIGRNIFAVVNSALKHRGVLQWTKKARFDLDVPFPNKFLGVESRLDTWLRSDAFLYACRYLEAKNRLGSLMTRYPELTDIIRYEEIGNNPISSVHSLFLWQPGEMAWHPRWRS